MVQKHSNNGCCDRTASDNIHFVNELRAIPTQIQGKKRSYELYAYPWNVPRIPYNDTYL